MIGPTDEMVETVIELVSNDVGPMDGGAARDLVAELLALAERQFQEQYGDAFQAGWWRGQHELCPRCGVALEREVREEQGTPRIEVVVWDYREQPDHDRLAAAISRVSAGAVHAVFPDTGSDEYALVLSDQPLTPEAAARLYYDRDGGS